MIDTVEILRLAADTGVLTLIWLVQLVIYPSFTQYNSTQLKSWHPVYTRKATYVILPLMLAQLVLSIAVVMNDMMSWSVLHLILVLCAWMVTFIKAVPLHTQLDRSEYPIIIAEKLVSINRIRTALWSITWLLSVSRFCNIL